MNKKAQIKILIIIFIVLVIVGILFFLKINEKEDKASNISENITQNKSLENLDRIENIGLPPETNSCQDECSKNGVNVCSGEDGYLTCGNFDADSCYEWSEKYYCPEKEKCSYDECVSNTNLDIDFSNIEFQSIKSASNSKVTLAYISKDIDLNLLSEIANRTSGITGEEGLLNYVPFSELKNNFEIVILKIPFDYDKENAIISLNHFSPDSQRAFLLNIKVHSGPDSEYAFAMMGAEEDFAEISLPIYNRQDNEYLSNVLPKTFVHEVGHAIGNLGDEYPSFANPYSYDIEKANIDSEGCPKWCSGQLNSDSPNYENYLSLKSNCVSPYINELGLLNIPDDQKKSFDNCLGGYPEYYNWNLGKNCLDGTGCFFGASGLLEWRSQKEGIMRNSDYSSKSFGEVGEKYLKTKLCLLLGSC